MELSREEAQKIVDEAPEGATHIINETYVKMNNDSVDSGWCKVWFEGKWMRNGYISNCTSLYDVREDLVSKAFEGAHVASEILAAAFNVETPEEKEALDSIKAEKVDDKQSVKVETEHQKEMAEFGVEWKSGDFAIYDGSSVMVIAYHPCHPVIVVETSTEEYINVGICNLSKPESPKEKEKRQREESINDIEKFICNLPLSVSVLPFALARAIVDKTKYRKGE